jgi:PAS domain S-box-containing protein
MNKGLTKQSLSPLPAVSIIRIIPLFLLASVLISLAGSVYAEVTQERHVLVLNSYHKGLSWTDSIVKGIESVLLGDEVTNVELTYEYMDSKRYYDDEYFQKLYEMYRYKYKKHHFDIVIVNDNDAFNFMRKYRDTLFPDTPVVFCGVNNYKDSLLEGHPMFTGIVEETDIKDTIKIALKLHPDVKRFVVLNDKTTTGIAMKSEVLRVAPNFKDKVEFLFLENFDMKELQREIRDLSPNSIILLTVVSQDKSGNFFAYEESLALIYAASRVPIYSFWDFYLDKGIIGGMLTSGFQQGREAAITARRVLRGEDVAKIPVVKNSPNRLMFDYKQLHRFGIKQSSLPKESVVINLPDTFFYQYRMFFLGTAAVILFLLLVIAVLFIRNSLRKKIEQTLRESEQKYRDFYENAPDMYNSVDKDGIIIDCNETGATMLGYRKEEIIGRPITDFYTDESKITYAREFPTMKNNRVHHNIEREFVRKDGTTFSANLNIFIEIDEKGELLRTKTIARDLTERKRVEELRKSQEQLRNLSAYLESAREEERKNIAREIHDELGMALSTLKLDLSWLRNYVEHEYHSLDTNLLAEKTQTMTDDVKTTIKTVQRISSQLRPGVLDNLGIAAAIQWQAGEFQNRTGIDCKTCIDEHILLDQSSSIALFRIFQETLTNIMRYAEATKVEIGMRKKDGSLEFEVKDNGRGITEEQIKDPTAFGLIGMKERARYLGGNVRINGLPDKGTTVQVTIPLTIEDSHVQS